MSDGIGTYTLSGYASLHNEYLEVCINCPLTYCVYDEESTRPIKDCPGERSIADSRPTVPQKNKRSKKRTREDLARVKVELAQTDRLYVTDAAKLIGRSIQSLHTWKKLGYIKLENVTRPETKRLAAIVISVCDDALTEE